MLPTVLAGGRGRFPCRRVSRTCSEKQKAKRWIWSDRAEARGEKKKKRRQENIQVSMQKKWWQSSDKWSIHWGRGVKRMVRRTKCEIQDDMTWIGELKVNRVEWMTEGWWSKHSLSRPFKQMNRRAVNTKAVQRLMGSTLTEREKRCRWHREHIIGLEFVLVWNDTQTHQRTLEQTIVSAL